MVAATNVPSDGNAQFSALACFVVVGRGHVGCVDTRPDVLR